MGGNLPGLLHLLQFLKAEYKKYIDNANWDRYNHRLELLDGDAALQQAEPVLNFFAAWLTVNRPVQTFAVDNNCGLLFSNGARCAVSPGVIEPLPHGSIVQSGAIAITEEAK